MSDETAKTHSQKEVKWQDAFFTFWKKLEPYPTHMAELMKIQSRLGEKCFLFFLNGVYGCHHSVNCSLGPPACIVLPPLTNFVDQNYLFRLFHFSHQFFLVRKCQ